MSLDPAISAQVHTTGHFRAPQPNSAVSSRPKSPPAPAGEGERGSWWYPEELATGAIEIATPTPWLRRSAPLQWLTAPSAVESFSDAAELDAKRSSRSFRDRSNAIDHAFELFEARSQASRARTKCSDDSAMPAALLEPDNMNQNPSNGKSWLTRRMDSKEVQLKKRKA